MKRLYITTALLLSSFVVFAQTKPTFTPDLSKQITITVKLPAGAVDYYIYALKNPQYGSSKLTGDVITQITAAANYVMTAVNDSLNARYVAEMKLQQEKFTADTSKKVTGKGR